MTLRLLMLAACLGATAGGAWAQGATIVTIADKPLRIIRGAAVYKANAGTIVQKDDIVETGAGSAQLEAGPDAIIAVGPNTQLYIAGLASDGKPTEVHLLQGWVKLASMNVRSSGRPGAVGTPGMHTTFVSGAVIATSRPGYEALFAEEGEQMVKRTDGNGKGVAPVAMPAEQFALALPGQALLVQPRPAKDFIREMPPQFRDRLAAVPASGRVPRSAALKDRDATAADVAPWLHSTLATRKDFASRFRAQGSAHAARK